jgi:hypothetical protein
MLLNHYKTAFDLGDYAVHIMNPLEWALIKDGKGLR